jgi:alkylglycerol monooxygenase
VARNYIQLAIPVFFLLIAVEWLAARLLERDTYRLADSVNDLSCGILQQLLEVFAKTALFAGYAWLYAAQRLLELPAAAGWTWVACFLGVDFLYYWFHRGSHEINAFWAAHVVHHQSEEYNLAVALRQGALQPAFSWVFYLPLALLGFPPAMFLAVSSFNTLYQFWIHTRLVGRLGPLEWVFNTPSHHRVHHARNPEYIDRNHGGTLIVWDRLFGTFGSERQEPVYGITRPLASWNPLWANLHYWAELWDVARRTSRPADALRLWWQRPGWRPAELGGSVTPPPVERATYVKYDVPLSGSLAAYVLVQFVLVNLAAVTFLASTDALPLPIRAAAAAAIALSLLSLGGLLDRRRWARTLEGLRLLGVAGLAGLAAFPPARVGLPRGATWSLLLSAVVSLAWLARAARANETAAFSTAGGLR